MAKRAILPVTADFLREALHLPLETEILGCAWAPMTRSIELLVEHPTFTEIPTLPRVTPRFEHQREEIRFLGWE